MLWQPNCSQKPFQRFKNLKWDRFFSSTRFFEALLCRFVVFSSFGDTDTNGLRSTSREHAQEHDISLSSHESTEIIDKTERTNHLQAATLLILASDCFWELCKSDAFRVRFSSAANANAQTYAGHNHSVSTCFNPGSREISRCGNLLFQHLRPIHGLRNGLRCKTTQ